MVIHCGDLADGDEDDDLPPEPRLVVPELVGTIPLPPPFLTIDQLRPSGADQPMDSLQHVEAMIQRTTALVHHAIKTAVVSAIQEMSNYDDDEDEDEDELAQSGVGLLADEEGYLLDAFLTRPPQWIGSKFDCMVLQAVVALPSNARDDERVAYYGVRQSTSNETMEVFRTQAEAVAAFEEQFMTLTGHAWADRSHQQQRQQQQDCSVGGGGASESSAVMESEGEGAKASAGTKGEKYLYLPTNHEAVVQQFGHAAQAEKLAAEQAAQVLARLPKPGNAVLVCVCVCVRVRVRVESCLCGEAPL
jgi:hypothetical protein